VPKANPTLQRSSLFFVFFSNRLCSAQEAKDIIFNGPRSFQALSLKKNASSIVGRSGKRKWKQALIFELCALFGSATNGLDTIILDVIDSIHIEKYWVICT
jgi:hypothetical protein